MSAVTLIELTPRRPADGVTETVRLCHNAVARANFLGVQWRPSAARLPSFESSLGFDGANFGRGTTPVVGDMEITLEETTRAWAGLIWKGAGITLRRGAWTRAGDDPADGDFQTIWQGRVDSAAVTDATLRLVMLDPGQQLRRPMVTRQFGSSGIAVLDVAPAAPQRGNLVPMGWGRLEGVPAILIDPTDLIYLLVGQPANGVQGFYDGGAAFTMGASRASLAALRATSPAAGAVDYCLNADGLTLARPWTKPVYPFTADLTVGDARPAELAVALVSSRTSIGFRAGTVAAYNALQGADIGLYVAEQVSIAECLDRIFAPLGSFWRLRSDGTIDLRRIDPAAAPVRSFGIWQRERPERRGVVMPTRRRTLGYKPNWRVHGEGEIARALLVAAGDVSYADGTPVEDLKPGELGANVTEARTSAAIAGQGPAATDPRGLGALYQPNANILFNGSFKLGGQGWTLGAWSHVTGNFGEGFYIGIGVGGTQQAVSTTFQASAGAALYLGVDLFAGGVSGGSLNADIEWLNSGGGVISQSLRITAVNGTGWTRYNSPALVAPAGTVVGRVRVFLEDATNSNAAARLFKVGSQPGAPFSDESTNGALYQTGANIDALRPGEFGANITEARTSAAIAGQSAWATYSALTPTNVAGQVQLLTTNGRAANRRINTQIISSGVIQLLDVNPLSASTDGSGVATISILAHQVFDDAGTLSFSAASISGLSANTFYYVYEDNPNYVGGSRSYVATMNRNDLAAVSGRRFVGAITTPGTGGSSSGSGGGAGGGPPGQWEFEP